MNRAQNSNDRRIQLSLWIPRLAIWLLLLAAVWELSSHSSSRLRAEYPVPSSTTGQEPGPAPTVQFSAFAYGVAEGQGSVTITVTLNRTATEEVRVNYATSDSTAVSPADYNPASGLLVFAPGQTSKTFTVSIVDDSLSESEETVALALSNPVNATLGLNPTATLTITDNTLPLPTIRFSSATYVAGEGEGTVTTVVELSETSTEEVRVDLTTSNDTAVAPGDYFAESEQLVFAAGELSKTIFTTTIDDALVEGDETFNFTLSNPVNAWLGSQSAAVATIVDNDTSGPTIQFAAWGHTVYEADEVLVITIYLSEASELTITVGISTEDGTAYSSEDYSTFSGEVEFEPGETSKQVAIAITDDANVESAEDFYVQLSNPVNATLGTPARTTITVDDDDQPGATVQFETLEYSVNELDGYVTIRVTLTPPQTQEVRVSFQTVDGTAYSTLDYTATDGELVFAPGETSKEFMVLIADDEIAESTEDFQVSLTDPINAALGIPDWCLVLIADKGAPPKVVDLTATVPSTRQLTPRNTSGLPLLPPSTPPAAAANDWRAPIDLSRKRTLEIEAEAEKLKFDPDQFEQQITPVLIKDSCTVTLVAKTNPEANVDVAFEVVRNPNDAAGVGAPAALPTIQKVNGFKNKATLGTDECGSFYVLAFIDKVPKNNKWDPGEQGIALPLILVRVNTDILFHESAAPTAIEAYFNSQPPMKRIGNTLPWTMVFVEAKSPGAKLDGRVDLVGGGNDGKLGLNRVGTGWAQQMTIAEGDATYPVPKAADRNAYGSFAANAYSSPKLTKPNGTVVARTVQQQGQRVDGHTPLFVDGESPPPLPGWPGISLPLLDTSRTANWLGRDGGSEIFLSNSLPLPRTERPLGQRVRVTATDKPAAIFLRINPKAGADELSKVKLNYSFEAFFVLYTDSRGIPGYRTYSVAYKASWDMKGTWIITDDNVFVEVKPDPAALAPAATMTGSLAQPGHNQAISAQSLLLEVRPPTTIEAKAIFAK